MILKIAAKGIASIVAIIFMIIFAFLVTIAGVINLIELAI